MRFGGDNIESFIALGSVNISKILIFQIHEHGGNLCVFLNVYY